MIWLAVTLFGLALGSFANAAIHRIPMGLSLIRPGSRCPQCEHPIAFYDNIPVLSYLWLRGSCRHCRAPISIRYPCVEILMALWTLSLALIWYPQWTWIVFASTASVNLLIIGWVDFKTYLIPDSLSLAFFLTALAGAYWNPILRFGIVPWWGALMAGSLTGFAFSWVLAWIGQKWLQQEALGGGDIKLLAGIGAWVGLSGVFHALLIASAAGSLYGLSLIFLKRLKRREPIPFGPFLALGTLFRLCLNFR